MAYPEVNTIVRQTANEITTIHNSVPIIQTIISNNSPTITTIVNGFWDAVWSVNGQTGDVRIEFTFDEFKPNTVYLKNQAIVRNDNIYIAKQSFTSGSTFNEADWNIIGDMAQASMVTYDNTETGISATTVQDALDYVIGEVPEEFNSLGETTSGEGTVLTLEKTANTPFKKLLLKGDTFQQAYTGSNLIPYINQDFTINGVHMYVEDGSLYLDGTSSSNISSNNSRYKTDMAFMLPAGTYTMSATGHQYVGDEQFFLHKADQTDIAVIKRSTAQSVTFTLNEETSVYLGIFIPTNTTFSEKMMTLRLCSGSSAADYEPYVGGQASPNPDYPQDIQVVTGEQTVKVVGKNLLPFTNQDFTLGNVHMYVQNGSLYMDGTSSGEIWSTNNAYKTNFAFELPAGTYTVSLTNAKTSYYIRDLSDYVAVLNPTHPEATFTLTEATQVYLGIYFYQKSWDNEQIPIQLEHGSTVTDYEPHQEQSYPISLVQGKNLLDPKIFAQGTFDTGTGGESVNNTRIRSGFVSVSSGQYTISNGGQFPTVVYAYDANRNFLSEESHITWQECPFTFTVTDAKYIRIGFRKSDNSTISPSDLTNGQLESGQEATTFAPFWVPELCKIGEYQDYLWTDGEKWYKHKAVGKYSFNGGNESIGKSGVTSNNGFYYGAGQNTSCYAFEDIDKSNLTEGTNSRVAPPQIVNYFEAKAPWYVVNTSTTGASFNLDPGGVNIVWRFGFGLSSGINTAALAKAFLTENNVTVYYPLATPTDEEITDATLLAQLEALHGARSYDPITNVSSNGFLPAILDVEAFQRGWAGYTKGIGQLADNVSSRIDATANQIRDEFETALHLIDNNSATAHNSICRGRGLTDIYTIDELSAKVQVGDFSDIYVGDYITKKVTVGSGTERELDFVIAHIDYFMHVGDTNLTRHHLVMVPDTAFYEYIRMNDTNTTTGGYYGSKGHGICNAVYSAGTGGTLTNVVADYTTFQATTLGAAEGTFVFTRTSDGWQYDGTMVSTGNLSTYGITYLGTPVVGDVITISYVLGYLEPYRQAIYTAFGDDHILAHRTQYSTSTSTSDWRTNRCELMNESMVYGQIVRANNVFGEVTENSQLAWFSARPNKRVAMRGKGSATRVGAWLSSINSGSAFCSVNSNDYAGYSNASNQNAVRPYFLFV